MDGSTVRRFIACCRSFIPILSFDSFSRCSSWPDTSSVSTTSEEAYLAKRAEEAGNPNENELGPPHHWRFDRLCSRAHRLGSPSLGHDSGYAFADFSPENSPRRGRPKGVHCER